MDNPSRLLPNNNSPTPLSLIRLLLSLFLIVENAIPSRRIQVGYYRKFIQDTPGIHQATYILHQIW